MKPFQRVLIEIDGTEKDGIVIKNIALMSRFMEIKKIYFMHCISKPFVPKSVIEILDVDDTSSENDLRKYINKQIIDNFPDIHKYNYELIIEKGDSSEKIVAFIKEKDIDFLALGREQYPGITYKTRKIGHLAPCSIGLFPLISKEKFRKIVVPVDFTSISTRGLERAYFYQNNDQEIKVLPVHFYDVPIGYYKTGKSYEQFRDLTHDNAKNSFEKVFKELKYKPANPSYDILNIKDDTVLKMVFNYALIKGADLIIMGSRGRTQFASFMLGSVAVKLLELIYHIPIIIEKDKEKNMGFADVFLQ
jgi:nucleotide-binding universal stress UspA family protein